MSPLSHIKTNFRSRLILIFTLFTGIISAAFVFVLITGEIRNYQERSSEKAQLLASLLAGTVTLSLYSENIAELYRHAQAILSTPHVMHVIISGSDNRILVDIISPAFTPKTSLVTSTTEVTAGAASPSAETALSGVRHSPSTQLGSISISIDAGDRRASFRSALIKTGGIALLFWIAVVAACYPVLKRVTRSFKTLTNGLDGMMGGDYSTKIIITKDDEAGRAAQAVNRLAAALEEREHENRILQVELVKAIQLEAQEERKKIMAKLIQTNRMTSLGLLISSIAHNINTPNGAIKLAAQYISGSWKDALPILEQVTKEEGDFNMGGLPFRLAKTEIKGASESILNNADRVERVIQDLRNYILGERNVMSPGVSVNKVVEEALTIIRAHGRQGEITIVPNLAPNVPNITGNQIQLEQVAVNLLLNAMQAIPDKTGIVSVRTEYSSETAEVRIIVADEGEGISPDVRKHLFEAFFTTRIDNGGSGLGLYISNFIVSEHNGRLTIDPNNSTGTIATVHIPVAAEVNVTHPA